MELYLDTACQKSDVSASRLPVTTNPNYRCQPDPSGKCRACKKRLVMRAFCLLRPYATRIMVTCATLSGHCGISNLWRLAAIKMLKKKAYYAGTAVYEAPYQGLAALAGINTLLQPLTPVDAR